jgi:polyribonucleotide nucleotidyltransferase
VANTTDVVKEGDAVKVLCLGMERGKVKLSMKRVDQETGDIIEMAEKPKSDKKKEANG